MAVKIGRMNARVVMTGNNPSSTLSGGQRDGDYAAFANTRGYLKKDSGNKNLAFGDILLENRWTLYVRYEEAIAQNIRADNLVVIDDVRRFKIASYELIDERNRFYKIALTETTK